MNKPGALSLEDQALLANGIAVVNLNLVDLLKLAVYQNVMTEQLHTELHQSINHFWETIHSKPETLSPLLSDMKDKPIFLRGASWGGRTAIRHAELFPNTFSGYISFDGSISSEMTSKSDRSLVGTRQGALAHLDPASHIQDIQDPILLIHNANDNNVNLKVSLDFYEKAKHEGKENLLSVHINQKGGAYEGNQGVWNTGHFTPNSAQAEFEHQVNAVSNFIIHGPDKLPELTNWRTVKYNSISDRNYNLASSSDLFVEYVNRTFKKDLPDHESLSRIFSVFELISKENADFIRSAFNSRIPDAELEAGLIKELKGINSYFREKFDIEFDEKIIPEMLNKYRDSILKADAKLHRELLLTFILANPHYVDKIHNYVSRKFGYDDYKRDTFIKLIKQRTAFRSASNTTLRGMLERGLAHEKQIETQIKNGDAKSLRNLISAYNASGNPKALSERLERILVEMPEDTKRDMLYKMGSELIADLSIRYEIFEVIRNAMTPDQYENLVINSKSNINAMMSDWSPVAQTERLMSTFKNTKSELRKEFLSINLLKNVSAEQLVNLMSDFSNDEVYELFGRVEGKETALSEKHDISYLEYVNERVGDERFKKLLEFDVGERLKGSILTSYRGSIKEFQFLIQRLSSEELIEHLQNNKNVSSYCDNLIVNMMASGNQEAFDVLTSKLESDGKADDIRTLMLDKDKGGQSGLSYAIELSAYNRDRYRGLLESVLKFCTAEDLALELKSKNSKLADMIRSSSLEQEMNRRLEQERLELIKSKLGEPLYKDVVEVNAKEISLEMISSKDEQFEKDVIALLGVEKVKESVNRHLDELISPYSISKGTFNLIRKYCSRADLGEKLAKGCAESIKEKMNSSWYSAGSISNVLDSLTPQEYVEFQKQLSLEPDSLVSYFRPEKLQSDKEWQGKIKELLSASDEMVPVVFNESVIKSILRVNLQGTILSKAIDDLTNKPNLNMLLNFMDLTENNPDLTNIVLAPSSQSLEKILTNGVKPPEAFGFCWKNIIFNILTADEIKASLTSDVLTMISNPQMLVDAIQKLSDKEVFVLFNQESCKAVLKQYPDEMLKAVAARIGEKNIEILTQEKIQGKTKPHGKMTHMFEREKDAKPKVSPEQEQGVKEQKKRKLNK